MFTISSNQIITLTRGDSACIQVFVNLGTQLEPVIYDLEKDDKLYFALSEPNQPFEHAIIRKEYGSDDFDYENHCLLIYFNSDDTEHLLPGLYYYQIKLGRPITEKGEVVDTLVDTIVPKTKFYLVD